MKHLKGYISIINYYKIYNSGKAQTDRLDHFQINIRKIKLVKINEIPILEIYFAKNFIYVINTKIINI